MANSLSASDGSLNHKAVDLLPAPHACEAQNISDQILRQQPRAVHCPGSHVSLQILQSDRGFAKSVSMEFREVFVALQIIAYKAVLSRCRQLERHVKQHKETSGSVCDRTSMRRRSLSVVAITGQKASCFLISALTHYACGLVKL